jgi:hypothetical protein
MIEFMLPSDGRWTAAMKHHETVGTHLVGSVRLGRDPALGSGPLATVMRDILSLLVYFAAVRAFGV